MFRLLAALKAPYRDVVNSLGWKKRQSVRTNCSNVSKVRIWTMNYMHIHKADDIYMSAYNMQQFDRSTYCELRSLCCSVSSFVAFCLSCPPSKLRFSSITYFNYWILLRRLLQWLIYTVQNSKLNGLCSGDWGPIYMQRRWHGMLKLRNN